MLDFTKVPGSNLRLPVYLFGVFACPRCFSEIVNLSAKSTVWHFVSYVFTGFVVLVAVKGVHILAENHWFKGKGEDKDKGLVMPLCRFRL